MSLQLSEIGGAQDFGDEFQFEEDSGALNSILNNQGEVFSLKFLVGSMFYKQKNTSMQSHTKQTIAK